MDSTRSFEILLVEDSAADVRLMQEALKDSKIRTHVNVAKDGVEAMAFLQKQGERGGMSHPDLILLDLNLPKKSGGEVLEEIKADPVLKRIPVVIFTSSKAEKDVLHSYDFHANCYISKPVDLEQFMKVVRFIEEFWLVIAVLPGNDF